MSAPAPQARQTLEALRDLTRKAALGARGCEPALGAAVVYGLLNRDNFYDRFADEALEQALAQRHGAALRARADKIHEARGPFGVLHVISDAYEFGGHTRLLEDCARWSRSSGPVGVVATRSAAPGFVARLTEAGTAPMLLSGDQSARAAALLALGRRAETVTLHIHPEDAASALAARLLSEEGRRVLFVNHSDHLFSFGPGASTATLEVSGFGWNLSAAHRPEARSHFLGLAAPVAPPAPPPAADAPVLSMGAPIKYRPRPGADFPAFAADLLARCDRRLRLIGPSAEQPWWADLRARFGDRVELLGPLPYARAQQELAAAACYVDSFPMTGGTALTQALMAGKTIFAPPYPAGGYSLADALRAGSIPAMTEALLGFLRDGTEPSEQQLIRDRIAEAFSDAAVGARFAMALRGEQAEPPPELCAAGRDIDYYRRGWEEAGPVCAETPVWARAPLSMRLRAVRMICGAGGLGLRFDRARLLWLLGPRARAALKRLRR